MDARAEAAGLLGGLLRHLLALFAGLLPRRLWREWEGRIPLARMAVPSALVTFLLGFAVGIPGFLDYAARSGAATSDLMLAAAGEASRGRASDLAPAGAWGLSLFTLVAYLLFTPRGLLASYLSASGLLRCMAAVTSEPHGDPLLSLADHAARRVLARASRRRLASEREQLEGPPAPDALVRGGDLGFPEVELILVASRRKPGWQRGLVLVTGLKCYRVGEAFDRFFKEGLRTLYPLNELPAAEVMRRSLPWELPPLSAYDPISRTTAALPKASG